MKVSIFGLGYVGVVCAACFAKLGHKITGVDVIDYKIDAINKGKAPLEEKGLNNLLKEQVYLNRLSATKNVKDAILNTDISFICVGTPPKKNGDLDLSILKTVCEEIGVVLKEKNYHIIVIRSTMFPGSFEILKNILEKCSGKKQGRDFDLLTNPEFLREGSAIKDFFNPPYIIVGTDNKSAGKIVLNSYSKIKTKKFLVKPDLAQMIKYANNSWHALKVTFANEIASICKEKNINSKKLMGLFCEDYQLNISPYYLTPGFAYGGSCLSKDTAALKNISQKLNLKTPVIDSISKSNMEQINRAIKLIVSKGKKKIGILGLTFKPNTDDIRGNPILFVINYLLNQKYNLKVFDSLIDASNIKKINNSYRKEIFDLINRENLKDKIEDISRLFSDLDDALNQDVIIISNRDKSLKKYLINLPKEKIIIDLQNTFNQSDFTAKYETL